MWFKRKPKNRRLERDSVLDVKLRSHQVRAARLRALGIGAGLVIALAASGCLVWAAGNFALNKLIYQNKAFAIEEIDVQTDGIIATGQLRRWTGVRLGQNLLALDLARVRRDLELVSLIQSVSVERVLPHTLRVRVIERTPIAQIKLLKPGPTGGIEVGIFLLDADGYVIVPLDPRQRTTALTQSADDLPVICGLKGPEIQAGHKIESPQLLAALRLLVAFDHSPMQGMVDLKTIDLSNPEVLVARTDQGSEITFGLNDVDQQLRRWRKIFSLGQQANRAIASLDLAVTNHVPLRWLEASLIPPLSPKPPKQQPKKRHV
ncbi:MAG TPA: FtsQ-type POTRA domain-containing protein [Candidatus Limnocylindrales bacterium]|nr:FtsQ-type POTRA domain-containing protein [Candidatus Limnocylindrales bacterium]